MSDNNYFDESTAGIAPIYIVICLGILISILIFG